MHHFTTNEVFPRESRGRLLEKRTPAIYCPGDSAGVSDVPAGDSVVAAGASVAAGLVASLVAGALVGAGVVAGVTVSVFCSHAARSAAPARMQMYFFIVGDAYCFNRSIAASVVFGPRRVLLEEQIARGQH
jgi:bifunctional ADP-heptose synthase (sugar kinase/adenylyltransferase)